MSQIDWVIFDLGAVLIDWNPRYVYRRVESTLPASDALIEEFLREVATGDWNSQMDAGTLFQSAIDQRAAEFPEWREWLQMWRDEWPTMMRSAIPDMVELFYEVLNVRRSGQLRGVLALSNWEANTFKIAKARFPFLSDFDARLISGEEKLIKPDPVFFKLLESRFGVDPKRAIFIDDLAKNIQVASSLGFQVHLFENAVKLRADLTARNILTRT
ncbi:HAD family phosphatase [soil metagenome]